MADTVLHGLHRGRFARGAAPDEVTREMGYRFGLEGPFARLFGDRNVGR